MVLGTAGDIAVHVAILLEAPRDSGGHQRLQRPEHGRATDAGLSPTETVVQILRGDLAGVRGQRIGDEQALSRDALAGGGQAVGGRGGIEHGSSHVGTR